MPQFLLIVGALLVLVGMGSIAAGAPDWVLGLSLGATLIQSGTIAFVGGLILIALGMVLFVMQDLLKRLGAAAPAGTARSPVIAPPGVQRQQPVPEPASHPREPAPEPAAEGSSRQPRESGTGNEPRPRRERPREPAPDEAARQRRAALPAPPAEDQMRPRREVAAPGHPVGEPARPRAARTLEQASEDLARMRSEYAATGRREEPAPSRREPGPIPLLPQPFVNEARKRASEPAPESPETYVPKFRPADSPAPASKNADADTVVRSGVIGGMAYTLYADGSIEAELAIGTVRFDSIAELQDHVTRTGAEADADFDETSR